jgi:hypothetical protein
VFADFNASPRPTHPMTERCPRTELKAFNRLRNVARTRAVGEAPSTIWARGARRSADWIKIKTARRQEAVIVGFTAPRRSRPYFGALVLALETATAGAMSATSARASYSALNELCGSALWRISLNRCAVDQHGRAAGEFPDSFLRLSP